MNDQRSAKKAVFGDFNPYEAQFEDAQTVSQEAVLLGKRMRRAGFDVQFGPDERNPARYVVRKGFSDILHDPVIVQLSGIAKDVAVGLVGSWLYDLMARHRKQGDIPDDVQVVIEMNENGQVLRYDHKGRELSNKRFAEIVKSMRSRQREYALSRAATPPLRTHRLPIHLEHTPRIVGWCADVHRDDSGLLVDDLVITDRATEKRLMRGKLRGLSVAGIVRRSECSVCKSDYRLCDHGVDVAENVTNYIGAIQLCEISVVRDPVNEACILRWRQSRERRVDTKR